MVGKWLPSCADGSEDCASPEAVCQDGTRPMVYLDPSASDRNDWIIYLGGEGRPCSDVLCWLGYRYAAALDDLSLARAMSTLHPEHTTSATRMGEGAVNANTASGNDLAFYNHVHFKRCTDGSSTAVEVVPLFDEDETQIGEAPVYHHGFDTFRALFHSLATPEGRDIDEDGTPDMPSLADAERIVLVASSDATRWMTLAVDRYADELRGIAGNDVEIRFVVDAFFDPVLDNEGRYAPDARADFNSFEVPYSEHGYCRLPDNEDGIDNEACSDAGLTQLVRSDGRTSHHGELIARGSVLDESCELHHGVGAPECNSISHTLLHHVGTPWLVLTDQEDPARPKLGVIYSDAAYPFGKPEHWRQRVLDSARDFATHWETPARHDGPGAPGDAVLILRKHRREGQPWSKAKHTHLQSDGGLTLSMTRCTAAGDVIASSTIADALAAWAAGELPFTYVVEDGETWDGESDYFVTGTRCDPPL